MAADGLRFGFRRWTAYRAGAAPVLLTAPHGGALRPPELPDRGQERFPSSHAGPAPRIVTVADGRTQALCWALAERLEAAGGLRPHVVTCHLHRVKVDPNRPLTEACLGSRDAERAYSDYHNFIGEAVASVDVRQGPLLLVDLHGHAVSQALVQLGYLVTGTRLRQGSLVLGETSLAALGRADAAADDLLWGQESIGQSIVEMWTDAVSGSLTKDQLCVVPSLETPFPSQMRYFSGGYTIERWHSSRVAAVQVEASLDLRSPGARRDLFVGILAEAIRKFLHRFVRVEPVPGAVACRSSAASSEASRKTGKRKGKRDKRDKKKALASLAS